LDQEKKSFWRRHRWLLWIAGAAVVVFVASGVLLTMAARRFEPWLHARIVQGMEERFHAHVELDQFHVQVNNIPQALRTGEWGIWANGQGLRIWPPTPVNGEQDLESSSGAPLITLKNFSFHVPLRLEKVKEIKIGEVDLDGLHMRVPPRSQRPKLTTTPASSSTPGSVADGTTLLIQRVVCAHADLLLETDKPGKLPVLFAIPHLTLSNVTPGGAMNYVADVVNPKPKGVIHAEGSFGPWLTVDPGMSPLSGKYHMDKNDMSVFHDIAGIITSDGTYKGTLRYLSVVGTASVPDFRLTKFNNPVPLTTGFSARVDGTDGDTILDQVNATLGHSQFTTSGQIIRVRLDEKTGEAVPISKKPLSTKPSPTLPPLSPAEIAPGAGGHSIDLNVNIAHGQIDDFLKLASKSTTPLLTGAVAVKAHLLIPPAQIPVEQRIKIDGTFQLTGTRFSSDKIQGRIQQLSLRGQGRPEDLKTEDPTLVRSEMRGSFHMANAVIALPDLDYSVPGADIQLKGSYSLDGALSFSGTARLQATVSHMVTGWKSMLLKPVDKFFQKDGAGTLVPINVQGTREAPKFNVDFSRMGFKGTRPESPADKQP
jgi:hypothetical protein